MLERMYGITPQDELPPTELEVPGLSIIDEENGESYGRFVVQPLEKGWGVTLGNPVRRILSVSYTHLTLPTTPYV